MFSATMALSQFLIHPFHLDFLVAFAVATVSYLVPLLCGWRSIRYRNVRGGELSRVRGDCLTSEKAGERLGRWLPTAAESQSPPSSLCRRSSWVAVPCWLRDGDLISRPICASGPKHLQASWLLLESFSRILAL